ncbi:MAG TPA: cytochrome bc complex cytochrome b subunit [Nitrososphaerales archaeon]|nr:cytochrome bc complex cytochrome b subunit [Nitrososphaerales archaeon]
MSENEGFLTRLAGWFDSRLGLSQSTFRPVPEYALNPFYWLGALAVVAFVIQGVTGLILMLYYVPSPSEAYSSTVYIFQNVYNGRFLQTVHLYTAYAMIMLAFMHLMRGYFVSVHKRPREAMWIVGMLMGFVTLGFGFTGYLLPWTVLSKSGTDVGVGMVTALPQPVSSLLTFLIVGGGGDAAELLRFFDLHVVVLPAILLILLVAKMYMLESHGVAGPTGGLPNEKKPRLLPIFPDVTFYLLELSFFFGVGMLLISAVFPLTLPPAYSAAASQGYIPQPDWYFLWIYQVLKISVFEGSTGLAAALSVVTLIFLALTFLPFIDRWKGREISRRPAYVTIGAVFVAEVLLLSYWGSITPGAIIPLEQAALVIGGTALMVMLGSLVLYRLLYSRAKGRLTTVPVAKINSSETKSGLAFTALVGGGALSLGSLLNGVVAMALGDFSAPSILSVLLSAVGFAIAIMGSIFLTYRLDLRAGMIKRRVRALELGWKS